MKFSLFAFVTFAVGAAALAVPVPPYPVVNPTEPMVVVPGLEYLGQSRTSTVNHCVTLTGAKDWRSLITDSDLESMSQCLIEHT
jgi:hypothetical protein